MSMTSYKHIASSTFDLDGVPNWSEAYSEPCQASSMFFAKTVNGFHKKLCVRCLAGFDVDAFRVLCLCRC